MCLSAQLRLLPGVWLSEDCPPAVRAVRLRTLEMKTMMYKVPSRNVKDKQVEGKAVAIKEVPSEANPVPSRQEGMRQPVGQHWENWLTKLRKALGQLFPPKLLGRIAIIPNDSTVMASKGRIKNTTFQS